MFADPDALPAGADTLFAGAAQASLFGSRAWYRNVVDHALAPGAQARFAVWPDRGEPLAVFPMRRSASGALESLTTPYTCLYAPLLASVLDGAGVARAGMAFGRFCRAAASVRLDALAADWPSLGPLLDGVRASGLVVRRFDHFGNWHEPVAGLSWRDYLDGRPGALRETVRRKLGKAERDPDIWIEVVEGGDALERGITAFEDVYHRSWKEPEPFPAFNAGLLRQTAGLGLLRLGILRVREGPVAVQFWVVEHGRASVLKLAHDEAFKAISPGTVLTAFMLRRLLDEEHVSEIDFGRGDDPYKRQWASRRRQRIGLLLLDPLRPRGLATLGRHTLGVGRRAAGALLHHPGRS